MSKLVNVDVFGPTQDYLDPRHPEKCPYMMAFLNIVEHHSVMTPAEEARLTTALDMLQKNLHDRGTIVVALPDWVFERPRLKGNSRGDVKDLTRYSQELVTHHLLN